MSFDTTITIAEYANEDFWYRVTQDIYLTESILDDSEVWHGGVLRCEGSCMRVLTPSCPLPVIDMDQPIDLSELRTGLEGQAVITRVEEYAGSPYCHRTIYWVAQHPFSWSKRDQGRPPL